MNSASRKTKQTPGFDYTLAAWKLANNICQNCARVAHVDMRLIAVEYARCRNDQEHGTLATLTALQENVTADEIDPIGNSSPSPTSGIRQSDDTAHDASGRSVSYLLTLFLPRFANLSYRDKLVTIAHELWHVSEKCDGRLRKFPGRCSIHGRSEKKFDAIAESIIDHWQTTSPPLEISAFLRDNLEQLVSLHGSVIGQQFRKPRGLVR